MRTVLYLLSLVFSTLWYGLTCIFARYLRIKRVPGGVYDRAQRGFGRTILWASGIRIELDGGENIKPDEPQIIASNHASFFDILAYLGHLPVDPKFVAKKELFSIPVFGPAVIASGHVRIDRKNLKEAFGAYEHAAKRIRDEKLHILVYPEGTRTLTGELLPFKKGPFVLAIECQAAVVPAYAHGAFGIMPKGSIRVRPHPIRLMIGEPIPTAGLGYEERDALATRVRDAVLALKARAEALDASGAAAR